MQIVIDTNILMSAIFFDGLSEKLIDLVLRDAVTAVVSEEILKEYEETTQNMILKTKRINFTFSFISFFEHIRIIQSKSDIQICRDPDDNKFISCAYDGRCSLIVSGDKDLLTIKEYQGIKIITIREFFDKYYKTEV